jgi:ferredoxin
MSNKITDECISCGACESECPNQAISQGADHFEIDPSKCNECEGKPEQACKAVCPSDCITKA